MKRKGILLTGILIFILFNTGVVFGEEPPIQVAGIEEVECYFSISG